MLFAVISTTAFGGAAIAMMRRDLVNKTGWLTEREFIDIYSIAQVSPGAIPVSIAVLVGRRLGGAAGFWLCLIAETVPGFLVRPATVIIALASAAIMIKTKLNTGLVVALAGVAGIFLFRGSLRP
jgi:chromate transport protein ChrA